MQSSKSWFLHNLTERSLFPIMCNNEAIFFRTILFALICSSLAGIFTNEWAVRLKRGADPDAVAELHNFENLGQVTITWSLCHLVVIVTGSLF